MICNRRDVILGAAALGAAAPLRLLAETAPVPIDTLVLRLVAAVNEPSTLKVHFTEKRPRGRLPASAGSLHTPAARNCTPSTVVYGRKRSLSSFGSPFDQGLAGASKPQWRSFCS